MGSVGVPREKKSLAEVVEGFRIDYRFVVISGSKNVKHIKDNLNIMDIELTGRAALLSFSAI